MMNNIVMISAIAKEIQIPFPPIAKDNMNAEAIGTTNPSSNEISVDN